MQFVQQCVLQTLHSVSQLTHTILAVKILHWKGGAIIIETLQFEWLSIFAMYIRDADKEPIRHNPAAKVYKQWSAQLWKGRRGSSCGVRPF